MKKLLLGSIALLVLAAGPAGAADIPPRVTYKAPVAVASAWSWTGFYVGGNIGGVREHASGMSNFTDPNATQAQFFTNPQSNSFSNTRFLGGVQAGYNWHLDPRWVAGVEADWDWTNAGYSFCRQTDINSVACTDNGRGFEAISSKTKWLATVRGRLGVTWGNWLFYGTGGAAWTRVDTTLTLSCLVNGCGSSTNSLAATSTTNTTKAGWAAGLGTEAMLGDNWSAKAEWLHIDVGTISGALPVAGGAGHSIQTAIWSRRETFDEFRVGLNYRFRP